MIKIWFRMCFYFICFNASAHFSLFSGQSYCRKCWWSCSRTSWCQLGKVLFFFALCLSLDWLLGGVFENHDLSLCDFVLFLLIYRHKCLLWRLCLITFCGTMLMCAEASYLQKKIVNIGMDRITEVFDWCSTFNGWFQLLMGPTLIFPLFSLCFAIWPVRMRSFYFFKYGWCNLYCSVFRDQKICGQSTLNLSSQSLTRRITLLG